MLLSALLLLAGTWSAAAPTASIEPPPGWTDVSAKQTDPAVLLALKGPETSSFMLARIKPIAFDNRGEVRAYLLDALDSISRSTGRDYKPATNVNVAGYGNGLSAQFLRADLDGKPRLIVAVATLEGVPMVATLESAVPETMLPEVLGGVRLSGPGADQDASGPRVETEDGQLSLPLAGGVAPRPLTDLERKQGFVLALDKGGAEMMIQKIVDDTPADQEPDLVRATVSSMAGVAPGSSSRPAHLHTKAGPSMVYSAGLIAGGGPDAQFVAGFLPWCYWGYSVLAKGPAAADLVRSLFPQTLAGSSAEPKLVAQTPLIHLPGSGWRALIGPAGLSSIVVLFMLLVLWLRRRIPNPGAEVVGYGHGNKDR